MLSKMRGIRVSFLKSSLGTGSAGYLHSAYQDGMQFVRAVKLISSSAYHTINEQNQPALKVF